jgi:transketolase
MTWKCAPYAQTLNELIERNPNIYCLRPTGQGSATIPEVSTKNPRNFINCGVQEANMIGVAAGLAREGKIPFCATFTAFATRRAYDQITISVAYANNNVKIVGNSPGITQGPNGGTHMCFQDLAIMRAMPNLHVYSPADANELRAVMFHMAASRQPTYMQLVRAKMPKLFEDGCPSILKAKRLHEGKDVTLIATGFCDALCPEVARQLEKEGVTVDLLHYPSVKPFDAKTLIDSARKTGAVVTVENQSIVGGLERGLRGAERTPPRPRETPRHPGQVWRGRRSGLPLRQARVRPGAHQPRLPGAIPSQALNAGC